MIAYIHCVYLGQPGLTASPASAFNFCVSRKAAWFTGRTSSYWGRAWTLVFSCLIFPLACHGIFCKLIACSSLYYGMQDCPWKVSSFKAIMQSFFVSWHSLLITVGQFSSTLKQVLPALQLRSQQEDKRTPWDVIWWTDHQTALLGTTPGGLRWDGESCSFLLFSCPWDVKRKGQNHTYVWQPLL